MEVITHTCLMFSMPWNCYILGLFWSSLGGFLNSDWRSSVGCAYINHPRCLSTPCKYYYWYGSFIDNNGFYEFLRIGLVQSSPCKLNKSLKAKFAGVIVVLGLGTALRLAFEFCNEWSLRRVVHRVEANASMGYHPAL